jgi:hypothetical protein
LEQLRRGSANRFAFQSVLRIGYRLDRAQTINLGNNAHNISSVLSLRYETIVAETADPVARGEKTQISQENRPKKSKSSWNFRESSDLFICFAHARTLQKQSKIAKNKRPFSSQTGQYSRFS